MFHNENDENQSVLRRQASEMYVYRDSPSCDEDSRDSGISEMDFEGLATTFDVENLHIRTTTTTTTVVKRQRKASLQMNVLDEEMDELMIRESSLSMKEDQALLELKDFGGGATRTRAFTDISNGSNGSVDSPKSRATFRLPFSRTQSQAQMGRKRTMRPMEQNGKRSKESDMENKRPSTCVIGQRPSLIQRTLSTSLLERGLFAHTSEELPQLKEVTYSLEVMTKVDSQAFRRINSRTLTSLMTSSEDFHEKFQLIDCRYPFEYEGGHIKNAINLFDPSHCGSVFFDNGASRRIPIFYCEFSQKRGPSMAQTLRGLDRTRNELQYPRVEYAEIYVLDEGYKGFFENLGHAHSVFCEPTSYIPMLDMRFSVQLKEYNFHRKGFGGTASYMRPAENRSRLLQRQKSENSPLSRPSNRLLFPVLESPNSPEQSSTPSRMIKVPQPLFS